MPTITGSTSSNTTTPLLIQPWRTSQQPATIVHDIQGASSPWVSLQPARTRRGTLSAIYATETDAETARVLLAGAELFEIAYPERPTLQFTFAVVGDIEVELQRDRQYWALRIPFREVT